MTTSDFITELFCRVDDALATMPEITKHPQARLYPSELLTLALLFALKGCGPRAFYRWAARDLRPLFPALPERTRLFRLFRTHGDWSQRFLAEPTVLGVIDSYGIELLHPAREGRSRHQLGRKGKSNYRWIIGGKLCVLLNQWGLVVAWDCARANVHDSAFAPVIAQFQERMIVLSDTGFHSHQGDPPNLKVCRRGTWNGRMMVETVFSLLTRVCHLKQRTQRGWEYFRAHLGYTVALFNLLVQWQGLRCDANGDTHLCLAPFSL